MNKNLTELIFILDKSGSMAEIEHGTIGGFNSMLAKRRASAGSPASCSTTATSCSMTASTSKPVVP